MTRMQCKAFAIYEFAWCVPLVRFSSASGTARAFSFRFDEIEKCSQCGRARPFAGRLKGFVNYVACVAHSRTHTNK